MQAKDRIFVAIDVDTLDEAKRLMDQCLGLVNNVKVGLQVATASSWREIIEAAHERGFKVFCDAKFKDIPNTVEKAAQVLSRYQPDYFTVMADNSLDALKVVRAGVDHAEARPKVVGVTVLTSIDTDESQAIYGGAPLAKALQFGANAVDAGFDALVCSPEEAGAFRTHEKFKDTLLITPGVRPAWAASNDQARSASPAQAIKNGADMLVIGRPITQPPSEVGSVKEAITRIIAEIEEAA
jgi:orotidine-5'-phosphate decarboxylase